MRAVSKSYDHKKLWLLLVSTLEILYLAILTILMYSLSGILPSCPVRRPSMPLVDSPLAFTETSSEVITSSSNVDGVTSSTLPDSTDPAQSELSSSRPPTTDGASVGHPDEDSLSVSSAPKRRNAGDVLLMHEVGTVSSADESLASDLEDEIEEVNTRFDMKALDNALVEEQLHNSSSIVARPGIGKLGRTISLRANFFEIRIAEDGLPVHQYHAEIHHPGMRTIDR